MRDFLESIDDAVDSQSKVDFRSGVWRGPLGTHPIRSVRTNASDIGLSDTPFSLKSVYDLSANDRGCDPVVC